MTSTIIKFLENEIDDDLEIALALIFSEKEYDINKVYRRVCDLYKTEKLLRRKIIWERLKYYLNNNGELLFEGIEEFNKH